MSFDGRESLEIEEGKLYHSKNGMIKIGTSEDEPVFIRNVHKIFVKEISETGYSTSIRIAPLRFAPLKSAPLRFA